MEIVQFGGFEYQTGKIGGHKIHIRFT